VFLQGQFSNDLRPLQAGGSVYGLWLTHKGKVLADSTIIRSGAKEYWIYSSASPAALIQKRLEDFIIADDVFVEDASALWESALIIGLSVGAETPPAGTYLVRARITHSDSSVLLYPKDRSAEVIALLGAGRELTAPEVQRLRIDAGIASVPADIGPEDLPNEGGLETEAISYDKGCYLGQEVMARLKTRGRIRRHLVRVAGAGSVPALPAALFQEGKKAGELRSAVGLGGAGFVGLALMGANPFKGDQPFTLEHSVGGEIRIEPLAGK
jgi:folate-binding protein YgfZ